MSGLRPDDAPDRLIHTYETEPLTPEPSPLERTATHESGHTIAARALDVPVALVTIVPDQGSRGHARVIEGSHFTALVIAASGRVAEEIAYGRAGNSVDGDRRQAAPLLIGIPWDRIRVIAREVLALHWKHVEKLSRALLERRTLTGEEVRALLGVVAPEASAKALSEAPTEGPRITIETG